MPEVAQPLEIIVRMSDGTERVIAEHGRFAPDAIPSVMVIVNADGQPAAIVSIGDFLKCGASIQFAQAVESVPTPKFDIDAAWESETKGQPN